MSAEIWTKYLFSSQHGLCRERPASSLHSLRWNAVAAWLPNQTPRVSSEPDSYVWLVGCFLSAKCCQHMFIHVATGCFIHQDGTYHSWIIYIRKKMCSLAATFEINKWKSLIQFIFFNGNVSEKKKNVSDSNLFKGEKWLQSTLLLKNNRAAMLSTFLSFGRPLIGSVEQQNCVYSS